MRRLRLCAVILCVLAAPSDAVSYPGANVSCFPAIFGFGDDWGDTGNLQALFPAKLEELESEKPYGMSYFGKPARRLSDGRLMLDFFAQALGLPFLSPYALGAAPSLHQGVSFAVAGSTARTGRLDDNDYDLLLQLQWLQKFQSDVRDAVTNDSVSIRRLPSADAFEKGLFVISAGQNDYRFALMRDNMTSRQVELNLVPNVVQNISATVLILSTNARATNFMVMNLPPLGCSPEILTLFASTDLTEYDTMGCLVRYNRITTLHNELLELRLDELRSSSQTAIRNLIYVDMAALMTDVLYDPPLNGFEGGLQACCGTGEPYNYNPHVPCGTQGFVDGTKVTAGACHNPAQYVNWDGIHTTEAFNRIAVESVLTGHYIRPRKSFGCHFDFDGF